MKKLVALLLMSIVMSSQVLWAEDWRVQTQINDLKERLGYLEKELVRYRTENRDLKQVVQSQQKQMDHLEAVKGAMRGNLGVIRWLMPLKNMG